MKFAILALISILICFASCEQSARTIIESGSLYDGNYTNKHLNLCIEPAVYASIYGFRPNSNELIEFGSKDTYNDSQATVPLVCLKDLLELRISVADQKIMGNFKKDASVEYFKTEVLNRNISDRSLCEIDVLNSSQIELDGKQFLTNSYHLKIDNKHLYEQQLFTHVNDAYLLFQVSDSSPISSDQIKDLFKAIKFDCL